MLFVYSIMDPKFLEAILEENERLLAENKRLARELKESKKDFNSQNALIDALEIKKARLRKVKDDLSGDNNTLRAMLHRRECDYHTMKLQNEKLTKEVDKLRGFSGVVQCSV